MRADSSRHPADGRSETGIGWRFRIDTGGTFTDCVALAPDGAVRRVKVLSTSALRGVVEEQSGSNLLRVRLKPSLPPDFLRGFRLRLLDAVPREAMRDDAREPPIDIPVIRHTAEAGRELASLELAGPLPFDVPSGTAFEVRSAEEAPLLAARIATGTLPHEALPASAMRLATTLATNALLERRGSRVALFLTRGFGDLLRIGTQQRPELFSLRMDRPEPLHERVVEVDERIAADGSALRRLEVQPLSMFDVGQPSQPGIVLGYGAIPTADIEEGLSRLRRCFDG